MTPLEEQPAKRPDDAAWSAPIVGLGVLASMALLLTILRVIDWTAFASGGWPRAELLGSLAASFGYLLYQVVLGVPHGWHSTLRRALPPPLAAMTFLALEAITLVLGPACFEWPTAAPVDLLGATSADAITGWVAGALGIGWLTLFETLDGAERKRIYQVLTTSTLVAAGLSLALPVEGPPLGSLPMPASLVSSAAAVPRTGIVCLPAVVSSALLVAWWRSRRGPSGPQWLANVGAAAAGLVLLLEVSAGRYSVISLGLAIVLVAFIGVVRQTGAAWFPRQVSDVDPSPRASSSRRLHLLLTVVFFFSGMAALVYQVVFAKGLALTFGSTSHASTIVLATYMGGLALGSYLGGRWAAKLERPVLGYASAELGIALICAVAPWTLRLARAAYVALATGADPSEPWLVGLQLGLGAFVLVPPTLLMGLTLPLLTRQFLDDNQSLGASAGALYTANTLGAAAGALTTGYFVLPLLGIEKSLLAAVVVNVSVACFAILAMRTSRAGVAESKPGVTTGEPVEIVTKQVPAWRIGVVATVQLTIGGFVTFGLETTFVHLLATVAGTSAYAFSLMLFAFLIGLAAGSQLGRRWLDRQPHLPLALLCCQLGLALTLFVAARLWDYLPAYFAMFGRWPYTLGFAPREFVRFAVCLVVMLPPAVCIGAQFPVAMEAVGFGWPHARIQALGRASALNTVGNILGALVIGFAALPALGSHRTLALLTSMCLLLAALALGILERPRRPKWTLAIVTAGIFLVLQPPQFDLTRLSSGGNVYFKPQYYGRVIDHAESLDGGLTAVTIAHEDSPVPVKTLLTNGKFQGNDRRDSSGEMMAQTSFAVAPLLHTAERSRALVIGFGTGTTTRVLDEAGFREIDVAELSGDIVELADRHFATINHGVIHRQNVRIHVTDGRNFLLLDRHQYDLISIELSSIWFAGAANLYNDEFYALVEPRLTEGGVLQQWVQLHRLSHRDVASILTTLRRRFPKIWLYFLGKQGILVACKTDCLPGTDTLRRLRAEPRLQTTLSVFPEGLSDILRGRLLTPEGIDALLEDYRNTSRLTTRELISSDDNLYLEYSTPRGNVREYDESIADNEAFLARFRAPTVFDATRLELNALN